MKVFDLLVLGTGVAGSFAAYKVCKDNPNLKVGIVDLGRPPLKRRRQMEGWLGCLPTSDGKFYLSDLNKLESIITKDQINTSFDYLNNLFSRLFDFKEIKTKKPSKTCLSSLKDNNYSIEYHDYFQTYPKNVHVLSKEMNKFIEDHNNLTYFFDEEISSVENTSNGFLVTTNYNKIIGKKILLSIGRSGWRFTKDIFDFFGIIKENNIVKYGVRAELGESSLKEFNKSVCTLTKDNIEIGKLSWNGTTIQEDHLDIALSSYRSNEERWKSEKVSFDIIINKECKDATYEADRIAKLSFLLANDRVLKEKIHLFMDNKAKISPLKEFDWLIPLFSNLNNIIPDFTEKAYLYYPTLKISVPKINIKNNFETDVEGLYVAGECSGNSGLLYSALTGISFANTFKV